MHGYRYYPWWLLLERHQTLLLEQFSAFESADALLGHAAQQSVEPVEPRNLMEGEVARVLLPGEPGYD